MAEVTLKQIKQVVSQTWEIIAVDAIPLLNGIDREEVPQCVLELCLEGDLPFINGIVSTQEEGREIAQAAFSGKYLEELEEFVFGQLPLSL